MTPPVGPIVVDEFQPPAPGSVPSPSPATKAIRERTYRDWFGDRWDDVKAIGGALMLTIRFLIWIFDLDDGAGSVDWRNAAPSATKFAGLSMVFVGLWVIQRRCDLARAFSKPELCGTDAALNAMIIAGVTALFGRALWKAFLNRNMFTTSTAATSTSSLREERKIDVRFTSDGVPAESNPPVVGARLYEGER